MRVAVVAVFNGHGRMLWGRRSDDGLYTTPGGHLEAGESGREGAVRELREEAGIVARPEDLKYLGTRVSFTGKVVTCYRLDLRGTPATSSSGDPDMEVPRWDWVELPGGRLPQLIALRLHVRRGNALVDILGLRYCTQNG